MTATLINAFIVPTDKEEEFLENWKKTTEKRKRHMLRLGTVT